MAHGPYTRTPGLIQLWFDFPAAGFVMPLTTIRMHMPLVQLAEIQGLAREILR